MYFSLKLTLSMVMIGLPLAFQIQQFDAYPHGFFQWVVALGAVIGLVTGAQALIAKYMQNLIRQEVAGLLKASDFQIHVQNDDRFQRRAERFMIKYEKASDSGITSYTD